MGLEGMTEYDRVDEVMGVKLGGKTGTGQTYFETILVSAFVNLAVARLV